MKMPAIPNTGRHIREYPLADAATFLEGSRVALTDGEVDLATDELLGFALHDAGADPNPASVLIAVAKPDSTFFLQGDRDPLASDEGKSYDLEEDADDITVVDTAAAGTTVFVEKVDLVRNYFEVRVTDSARQSTGGTGAV